MLIGTYLLNILHNITNSDCDLISVNSNERHVSGNIPNYIIRPTNTQVSKP